MAELFYNIKKSTTPRDEEFLGIEKFNPYHGADGRFTSAGGATSFTYKPGASKAHNAAISREKERSAKATPTSGSVKTTQAESKPDMKNMAFIGTPRVSTDEAAKLLHHAGWTSADRDTIEMEFDLTPDYADKVVAAMKKKESNSSKEAKATKTPGGSKKNQPEGDRKISNRKGGEIMDDIGTPKVSTRAAVSALKQAGFKRKDMKQIQRQYDLSDAQAKEISDNWNKYR